MDIYNISY